MSNINKIQLPNGEVYNISTGYELFIEVSGSSSIVTGSLSGEQLTQLGEYLDNIKDIYIQLDATESSAFHNKVYFITVDIIGVDGNTGTFISQYIDGNNLIKFSLQVNTETFENSWTAEIIDNHYTTSSLLTVSVEGENSSKVTGTLGVLDEDTLAELFAKVSSANAGIDLRADDNPKFHEANYLLPIISTKFRYIADIGAALEIKAAIVDNKNLISVIFIVNPSTREVSWTAEIIDNYYASEEVDTSNLVTLDGNQTISGQKTFSNSINLSNSGYSGGVSWNYTAQETFLTGAENGVEAGAFTIENNGRLYVAPYGGSSAASELIVAKVGSGNTRYTNGAIIYTQYMGTPTSLTLPSTGGTLATQEWVQAQGYGSGGGIDLAASYLWTGTHTFENPIALRGESLIISQLGTIEDDGDMLNIYHEYGILLEEGTSGAHISISHENGIEYYSDLGHSFSGPVAFDNCPTVNNQKVITADNFDYENNVLTIKLSKEE